MGGGGDGGRGGGVRKFKDNIFGRCVWLWGVIFEPVYFLGCKFDAMACLCFLLRKKKTLFFRVPNWPKLCIFLGLGFSSTFGSLRHIFPGVPTLRRY